jgi:PAS domain S-box-containing protein
VILPAEPAVWTGAKKGDSVDANPSARERARPLAESERKLVESEALAGVERAQRQPAAAMRLAVDEALATGDLAHGFRFLAETVCAAFDVDRVGVWLLSADGEDLECVELYDAATAAHSRGEIRKVAEYPAYFSALGQTGRICVRDMRADPATAELAELERDRPGVMARLDTGVHLGGRLVGVVSVEDSSHAREWPADEEAFAAIVASLVAQMLLNSRRRQAEAALRESEEKFRNLVEATSDWIWETDAMGRYIYASPRVRDLLGYEPSQLLGLTPFSLMPVGESERVRAEFERAAAEHRPILHLHNLNLHKQGHLVALETSGVPRFDAQGQCGGPRDRDSCAIPGGPTDRRVHYAPLALPARTGRR